MRRDLGKVLRTFERAAPGGGTLGSPLPRGHHSRQDDLGPAKWPGLNACAHVGCGGIAGGETDCAYAAGFAASKTSTSVRATVRPLPRRRSARFCDVYLMWRPMRPPIVSKRSATAQHCQPAAQKNGRRMSGIGARRNGQRNHFRRLAAALELRSGGTAFVAKVAHAQGAAKSR